MDMKRMIALVLTALMLLAPAACAVQGPDVLADPAQEPDQETVEGPADELTEEAVEPEEPEAAEEPEEAAPAEEPEEPEETEATPEETPAAALEDALGDLSQDGYVNTYFDISFAPGEDWTFYSRDDLMDMKELAGSFLAQYDASYAEMFDQALSSDSVRFVMAAVSPDNTRIVLALVEDLHALGSLATQQALLEHITDTAGLDEDTLTALGLTIETNTCTLAGREEPGVILTLAGDTLGLGAPICQQTALLMTEDYAMQLAMVSLTGQESLEKLVGSFSPAPLP